MDIIIETENKDNENIELQIAENNNSKIIETLGMYINHKI